MDDDSPLELEHNIKMAELFMECEEEDLEPWQIIDSSSEDDLIFVGEIPASKPASSSSSDLNISSSPPEGDPTICSMSTVLYLTPDARSTDSMTTKNYLGGLQHIDLDELARLQCNQKILPKSPVASKAVMQGTDASSSVRKACPRCSTEFKLCIALKCHMKRCCPDMANNFMKTNEPGLSHAKSTTKVDSYKERLVMLVSDFYYGQYEGSNVEETKSYTTFQCPSCLKVFKNNIRFMNHLRYHVTTEKQSNCENPIICQYCFRQYPTSFQLQCHIESTHTLQEVSTICRICELSFASERILLLHMKDTHKPGEMPYICQVCQFRSSTFADVETHFKTFHENTKHLLCPFCLKVSEIAASYMNHYMSHQKKGVHRCTKCRLQFLTAQEKMDHKLQHRTFIKPKELQGLPSGTKVTIRASFGHLHSKSLIKSSISTSLEVLPPCRDSTSATSSTNANASKTSKPDETLSSESPASTTQLQGDTANPCMKPITQLKSQRNGRNTISIALKKLRCRQEIHTCIECHSKIKDFASHFSANIHCSFCKYNTNCNKARREHMTGSHGNSQRMQIHFLKKRSSKAFRGITVVCLHCDFLTDYTRLDRMAKHLSLYKNHSCQVVVENMTKITSTSDLTAGQLMN
ncbi:zinc finger protein 280C isoform X1 [Ochotona princeps]|uniref:zinc finger protein 280C isoform X1 n=4 Tax=Ochotona princeps TaxID=9978 RepID=UPI002714F4D5|nr:zinc finger protein 280C isoform X1 [Ochotona princeps]XP_058514370.1 zinc finger protein 280C isoform X1 [Ochotona princeps]